jgi:hypothetical protein
MGTMQESKTNLGYFALKDDQQKCSSTHSLYRGEPKQCTKEVASIRHMGIGHAAVACTVQNLISTVLFGSPISLDGWRRMGLFMLYTAYHHRNCQDGVMVTVIVTFSTNFLSTPFPNRRKGVTTALAFQAEIGSRSSSMHERKRCLCHLKLPRCATTCTCYSSVVCAGLVS